MASFQQTLNPTDPATYIDNGAVTPQNNWAAQAVHDIGTLAAPIKQGIGLGMGERIATDTLDQVLSATIPTTTGDTQAIGLNGQVSQYNNGQPIGGSPQIDPSLVGAARDAAINQSTGTFNQQASKVKRAYELGLITDKEYYAKLSLNLKQAANTYPMFEQELHAQAQQMLSDPLYYYHYGSAVSGLEQQRKAAEAQQAQQAQAMQGYVNRISTYYGVNPALIADNLDSFSNQFAQDVGQDRAREQMMKGINLQKGQNDLSDHETKLQNTAIEKMMNQSGNSVAARSFNVANSIVMDALKINDPTQIDVGIGNMSKEQNLMVASKLTQAKQQAIAQYQQMYPGQDTTKQVKQISDQYDSIIGSLNDPSAWKYTAGKAKVIQNQAIQNLGVGFQQMNAIAGVAYKLGPTAQLYMSNTLNEAGVPQKLGQMITDSLNYSADGVSSNVSALNRATSNALIDNMSTPDGKASSKIVDPMVTNSLASEQKNIAAMNSQGNQDAIGAQRDVNNMIVKADGVNPQLFKGTDPSVQYLKEQGVKNVDTYIMKAALAAPKFIAGGQVSSITVDPTTGMVKLVGDQPRSVIGSYFKGNTTDAGLFVSDINKAIRAKAILSGDSSVKAIGQLSQVVVSQMLASSGDPQGITQYVANASPPLGLNPIVMTNMVKQESALNPDAVSSTGARGLFQMMPDAAKEMGVTNPQDLHNPLTNIQAGMQYYKKVRDTYIPQMIGSDNDTDKEVLALMAYNWGIGNVQKYVHGQIDSVPKETKDYVNKVWPGHSWMTINKYKNRYIYGEDKPSDLALAQ